MEQTNMTIPMDVETKEEFERLCNDVGLDAVTVLTLTVKQAIRKNEIPIITKGDPFYSASNMDFLREGVKELNAGKGIHKTIAELESM